MSYLDEERQILIGVVCGACLFLGALVWVALLVDASGCHARWAGRESRYGMATGCMVRIDGAWVPESAVRVNVSARAERD